MDIATRISKPVLSQLLSRIRTCNDGTDAASEKTIPLSLRGCDFFGSPLRGAPMAARLKPYPDLFKANDKYPRLYPERSPILGDERQWLVEDWPLPPAPNDVPESLIVFQELLRCVAAPLLDTEPAEHADEGLLRPGVLTSNYFAHCKVGDVIAEHKNRHRTAFRDSVLRSYTLLLLRRLAEQDGRFTKWILLEIDYTKRVERFRKALQGHSEAWSTVIELACEFLGNRPYEKIFIEHCFLDTLQGLEIDCTLQGAPRRMKDDTGASKVLKRPSVLEDGHSLRLPQTLSALIHLCVDRFGLPQDEQEEGNRPAKTASMFPDNKGELLKNVLSDARRLQRADDLLHPAAWQAYSFKLGKEENQGSDRGPSIRMAYWACFCLVLEALIAGELVPVLPVDIDPDLETACYLDENVKGEFVDKDPDHASSRQPALTPARAEKIAIMKPELSKLARDGSSAATRGSRSHEVSRSAPKISNLQHPAGLSVLPAFSAPRFDFQKTALWNLDAEQFDNIYCPVERSSDGDIPPGGIWLPLANNLVDSGAPVEVLVYRCDKQSAPDQESLVQLDIGIADEFLHDDGLLLSLEPEDWDDKNLLPGYAKGEFDTISLYGLVGQAEAPECILVMIACLPKAAPPTNS